MSQNAWQEVLTYEHDLIVRGLALLNTELDNLEAGKADLVKMQQILDFLLDFGDKVHNVKEENHLFPLLVERGVPQSGLIRDMLLEHEAERELLVRALTRLNMMLHASLEDRHLFVNKLRAYAARRQEHIEIENKELYPLGIAAIPLEDVDKLLASFARVDEINLYQNAVLHFTRLLQHWEERPSAPLPAARTLSNSEWQAVVDHLPLAMVFYDAQNIAEMSNSLAQRRTIPWQDVRPAESQMAALFEKLRSGSEDSAVVTKESGGRNFQLVYRAVRNEKGVFIGTLEIVTEIKP